MLEILHMLRGVSLHPYAPEDATGSYYAAMDAQHVVRQAVSAPDFGGKQRLHRQTFAEDGWKSCTCCAACRCTLTRPKMRPAAISKSPRGCNRAQHVVRQAVSAPDFGGKQRLHRQTFAEDERLLALGHARQAAVEQFQRRASGFDAMILSPKAGGVGLTLTCIAKLSQKTSAFSPLALMASSVSKVDCNRADSSK
jgi:hypothetical protein